MPYWQNPRAGMTPVGFGGGVSPVKQQGSVTPGGVAVWYDEGILVDGSAPGGLITDAPLTGGPFARQGGAWIPITGGGGGGTLTSITAGTGLSGGTITTSGTIALATPVSLANGGTGVSAGSATAALTALGGAPLNSAALTGTPTLVTPPAGTDDSNALATTAWVTTKLASATAGVSQITATTPLNASAATGNVALTLATVPVASGGTGATTAAAGLAALGGAPLLSPPLTGIPTAPTAAVGTDTTQVATTAFVKAAVDAIDALPTGGTQYDVLSKASATAGDVEWRGAGVRPNSNTAIGTNALNAATTGNTSVAMGFNAAQAINGNGNTAIGANAIGAATATGDFNTAVGQQALFNNGGSSNVAVGRQSLTSLTGASGSNIAVGGSALGSMASGSGNVAIGSLAGQLATAGNNLASTNSIFVGAETRSFTSADQTNEIVFGYDARGMGSNTIVLGNEDVIALYTRAGLVIGQPTGGAQGQGSINAEEYLLNGEPMVVVTPTVAWTAGTDPGNVTLYLNNTGRDLEIMAIIGVAERRNNSTARVWVVKAQSGSPLSSGIQVHATPPFFNADEAFFTTQTASLVTSETTLPDGWRLGLQSTAVTGWEDSVASITAYLAFS